MNDATQKLVTDVKTAAADMRELITATAEQSLLRAAIFRRNCDGH